MARNTRRKRQIDYNQRQTLPIVGEHQHPTIRNATDLQIKQHEEVLALTESWLVLFGRVNSLISGREITCQTSSDVTIAATDGSSVLFNTEQMHKLFREAISGGFNKQGVFKKLVEFRGLNYHELSHILWSPRKGQKVFRDIVKADQDHITLAGMFFKSFSETTTNKKL